MKFSPYVFTVGIGVPRPPVGRGRVAHRIVVFVKVFGAHALPVVSVGHFRIEEVSGRNQASGGLFRFRGFAESIQDPPVLSSLYGCWLSRTVPIGLVPGCEVFDFLQRFLFQKFIDLWFVLLLFGCFGTRNRFRRFQRIHPIFLFVANIKRHRWLSCAFAQRLDVFHPCLEFREFFFGFGVAGVVVGFVDRVPRRNYLATSLPLASGDRFTGVGLDQPSAQHP